MGRAQTLLTSFKPHKRSGAWTDADHSRFAADIERWSQTLPFGDAGFQILRIIANDSIINNGANGQITFNFRALDQERFVTGLNTLIPITIPQGYGGWYFLHTMVGTVAAVGGLVGVAIQLTRGGVTTAIIRTDMTSGSNSGAAAGFAALRPGDQLSVVLANRSGAAITPAAVTASTIAPNSPYFGGIRIAQFGKKINS